jgi:hypothetical protein
VALGLSPPSLPGEFGNLATHSRGLQGSDRMFSRPHIPRKRCPQVREMPRAPELAIQFWPYWFSPPSLPGEFGNLATHSRGLQGPDRMFSRPHIPRKRCPQVREMPRAPGLVAQSGLGALTIQPTRRIWTFGHTPQGPSGLW